jgi:hypothetical protein
MTHITAAEIKNKYGDLLTTDDVADLFRCKPESLRVQMCRNIGIGKILKPAGRRIGKRNLYPADSVALILSSIYQTAA